jgi:hypothetical protein
MRFIVSREYSPYGRISLISKLGLGIGAAVLIVATAAITATVMSRWNPFPAQDYEDCAARSAKDAKSKDALSVLLSICSTEFKGRRKAVGGYTYYDRCLDRVFDIKGPNPTTDEQKDMREECLAYLDAQAQIAAEDRESERKAEQAAREAKARELKAAQQARAEEKSRLQAEQSALAARQSAAMTAIRVTPEGFKCDVVGSSTYTSCDRVAMKVEVKNESDEALSSIWIGLAFVPPRNACPSSYAEKHELYGALSPGETRTHTVDNLDAALSKLRVCIAVASVKFSGD